MVDWRIYHLPRILSNRGSPLPTYGMLLAFTVSLLRASTLSPAYSYQDSVSGASEATSQILLSICDDTGNTVPAPSKESMQLHIGGQLVEIREIRSMKDSPLFFSVLVDVSGSSKQFAEQQISAATKLFRELSIGDNRGYLILFRAEFATNDHFMSVAAVENALKQFPAQSRSGGTALYDALIHAATEQLTPAKVPRDSRRAIFVLSDAGDNSSNKSLDQTLKVLQREGIPVSFIGFSRSKGPEMPRQMRRELETLRAFNEGTGGWTAFLDEPGVGVEKRAASLTNGQYLILFKSPVLKPNKSYPLKIKSSAKHIYIMAPNEYVIP